MRINLDNEQEEARIEIVPLIDVIFCILTFFILASLQLTRQQAIGVDLPQAGTGTPQTRDLLIVSLDDLGQVYVEQKLMNTKDDIYQSLRNYSYTNPNGLMVLYASRNSRYDEVVQVLDILREVGGSRVALATLPGANDKQKSNGNNSVIPTLPSLPSGEVPIFNPNSQGKSQSKSSNPVPNYNPLLPNQNPDNSGGNNQKKNE